MISVIIPTYKSPQALDLCLRSAIEGQLNKNQIIVVVDGFYDLNKEVLEKWKDHIEILNLEENVGLCRGTNLGANIAPRKQIGTDSTVGINSSVISNVKDGVTVYGNPAKIIL